jgi:YbbR domain-containing protein
LAAFVRKQENLVQRTILLPINITPPVGQRMVDPARGANVEVELEGPTDVVRSIQDSDVSLVIDTSSVHPGKRVNVPVLVELPEKYHRVMVDWKPRSIGVRFVSDTSKKFTIGVKALNPLEEWDLIDAPVADVEQVMVSGTEEAVARVTAVVAFVPLEPVASINALVTLQALDADSKNITDLVHLHPPQVMVRAMQQRVVLQKRVQVQPVWEIPVDTRPTSVEVNPERVRVTGNRKLVSDLDMLYTERLTVPPGKLEHTQEVSLEVPEGLKEVSPQRVRVTIRLAPLRPRGSGTEPTGARGSGPEPAVPRTGTNEPAGGN